MGGRGEGEAEESGRQRRGGGRRKAEAEESGRTEAVYRYRASRENRVGNRVFYYRKTYALICN